MRIKTMLLSLVGLLGPFLPPAAYAGTGAPALKSYVAVVRVTPGASPSRVLAFQNTATDQDVIVNRIEIAGASTQTVTGGLMQFWVYGSTQLTHSALTTVQTYGYANALVTAPSAVSASTAPTIILFDGDTSTMTASQQNGLSGTSLPLIRPLVVNNDEAAAANFSDAWSIENPDFGSPLLLPKNTQRALVIEKRQQGSSDFTAGLVYIRIHYTLR